MGIRFNNDNGLTVIYFKLFKVASVDFKCNLLRKTHGKYYVPTKFD